MSGILPSSTGTGTPLPCPLCGGEAQLGSCWVGERKLGEEPAVRCTVCSCRATLASWQSRHVSLDAAQRPVTRVAPGIEPWTPDGYWEYVGGLAGEWERDQMRDTLAERGLQIVGRGDLAYGVWQPPKAVPQPASNAGGEDKWEYSDGSLFRDGVNVFHLGLTDTQTEQIAELVRDANASRGFDPAYGVWQPPEAVPPVSAGNMKEFIVAVYRSRTGKVYTFGCNYLNEYQILYEDCPKDETKQGLCDGCGDDGCPTSGWFYLVGDGDNESGCYQDLDVRGDDKLVGWQEMPKWAGALPSTEGK